jgi:hypothetical protein
VRSRKGVGHSKLGEDDNSTMDSSPQPVDMGMPEKCTTLAGNGEIVQKAAPWLDWALCNVGRSIIPPGPDLPYPMPDYDLVRKLSM